jgi:TonB family protein
MSMLTQLFSLALLHFVWQGTFIAILLAIGLFGMRKRSANARYLVSCAALAVLLVLPVLTMYLLYQSPAPVSGVQLASPNSAAAPLPPRNTHWLVSLEAWVVPVWCFGVLLFSIRLVWGSRQVSRLRHHGQPAGESLHAAIARLGERMGLKRRVGVLIADLGDSPSVVGLVRPVILLPAATLLGLSPEQLEAVLAHELAHIRRYDYLINLLQMLAEALLFYHPAVWWISARIRRERELCCDDEAVRACGNSFCYARALTALERLRVIRPRLALGSTDGPLAYRIKRLVGVAVDETLTSKLPGLLALCLALALLAATVHRVRAQVPTDAPGVRVDLGGATVIHRTPIEYPPEARNKNLQGMIALEVHLDAKGNVTDALVVSDGPAELRKTVFQSVVGWHFAPRAGGDTRVISVEFQPPSEQPRKQAAAPPPAPASGPDATARQLGERFDQRDADEEARMRERLALATLSRRLMEHRQTQGPRPLSLTTVPNHPEPLVLPPMVAEAFNGRTLRNIRLRGLGMSKEDFLVQAQVPIHEGDTLTQSSIEATIAAIRNFDEHLAETWSEVEPNALDLTIFPANESERAGFRTGSPPSERPLDPGAGPSINLLHLTPKTSVQPFYPQLAKQAHIQGAVKLNATIGKEGNVVNLTVITGHPLLVPCRLRSRQTMDLRTHAREWRSRPNTNRDQHQLLTTGPIDLRREAICDLPALSVFGWGLQGAGDTGACQIPRFSGSCFLPEP